MNQRIQSPMNNEGWREFGGGGEQGRDLVGRQRIVKSENEWNEIARDIRNRLPKKSH